MGKNITWFLFILAAAAFAASLSIHVAMYFDVVVTDRWPLAWGAYVLVFVLTAYGIAEAKARTKAKGKTPLFTAFEPSAQAVAEIVAGVLLVYAMLVFAMSFFDTREGNLNRVGGRPVLSERGKIVRDLTESEYTHLKAAQMRGFSAILLFFSGVNAMELLSLVLLQKKKPE